MSIVLLLLALAVGGCGGSDIAATATVEATATPELSAAVPTATPEPASANVVLGQWQLRQGPNEAQVFIEGEVLNAGEAHAQEIMVDIQLFDASATLLGAERAFVITDIVHAGGMSPFFAFMFDVELADVNDTQIEIAFNTFDEDSYHGFTYSLDIEVVALDWMPRDISGELRNRDEFPLKLVTLAIIGYDEHGGIVAVERATMDTEQVEPGATATFSARILGHDDVPARVVAVAQGVRVR